MVQACGDIIERALAAADSASVYRHVQGRQQHGQQYPQDRNDRQEFNQRERSAATPVHRGTAPAEVLPLFSAHHTLFSRCPISIGPK
jgi:hypothetical protein